MPTLNQRIKFAEDHIVNKEGRKFSLEGRPWVRSEFWGPADGWKLWPNDPALLCEDCKDRSNSIVEWSPALKDELASHTTSECAGLRLEPIMLVVLNLPRRGGKTFSCAGYALSSIFIDKFKSITLVASAGKQTQRLYDENYVVPIENNAKLKKAARITGHVIEVPQTKSKFEYVDTSHKSITGSGRTHVIIDEARDVDARTAAALIPSMRDQNGVECLRGHVHKTLQNAKIGEDRCPVCNEFLVPWYGRIIILSSSGILEGTEQDWFAELVDSLEAKPHPNAHLYRSEVAINPAISAKSTQMLEEVFGTLNSMGTYMDVELSNVSRRKGEDFVTSAAINQVTRPDLFNFEGCADKCVGFLDTSLTGDTTSLVILGEHKDVSKYPWEIVRVLRIDTWEPKKLPGGVIDPKEIQAHFDRYLPLFPNLLETFVDVRAMTWARDFVMYNNTHRPGWGRKVKSFHGGQEERNISWNQLEQRIMHKKIWLPKHKMLHEELKGVRRITKLDGTTEIRDRSRKKRHADVAESLAACCYLIYLRQTQQQLSLRDVNEKHRMSGVLEKLYRPITPGGMSINDF